MDLEYLETDVGDFQPFKFNRLACGGGGGSSSGTSAVEENVSNQLETNLFPAAGTFFKQGFPFTPGESIVDPITGEITKTPGTFDLNVRNFDPARAGFFAGNRLVDESPQTLEARRGIKNILLPALQGQGQELGGALSNLLSPDFVEGEVARGRETSQGLIDALSSQAGESFARNILPSLQTGAAAAGQFGSSRQGVAEGVAAGDAANSLQQNIAQVLQQDLARQDALRQSAIAQQLNAIGLSPTVSQQQMLPFDIQSQLGATREQRLQQELNEQIRAEEFQRNAALQQLQTFQGLLGFRGPEQFTPTASGSDPSKLQSAAGGALIGAQLGSVVPGIGTGIGAGIGGGLGLLGVL